MRELGIRPSGGIRVDSLGPRSRPGTRTRRPTPKLIAETFREAGDIAADHGEFIVAEGEICWGGMHSWRTMRDLLEAVGRPGQVGYQADMAHSMLYTLGYNAEADRILPADFDWTDNAALDAAYRTGRRRAAPLDPRLPRRPERRHRLRLRRPREDRPPLPRRRPQRPPRHRQARRLLAPRRERQPDQDDAPHLLGRLHAPERGDGGPGHLERRPRRHGQGPRRPRLDASDDAWPRTSTSA